MTQAEKTVMKTLLDEVIGLRAAIVVLSMRVGGNTSTADAATALSIARLQIEPSYTTLKSQIEAL